jgi:tRNA-2-methylthio-N6-dimethylallyladenosine synthase
MDERLKRLQALVRDATAFNQASVGRRCEVLVERRGRHEGNGWASRPGCNRCISPAMRPSAIW